MNKDEINCIGAYLSDYKRFKILNLLLLHPELSFFGENIHFKQILKSAWKQWRLFCFVLFCRLRNSVSARLGLGLGRYNVKNLLLKSDWKQWRRQGSVSAIIT